VNENENESLAGLYAKVYAAAIATDRRDPAAIARAAVRDFEGLLRERSLAQREQQAAQARDQRAAWEDVLKRFPLGMRVRWTIPGGFRYGEVVSHMLATRAVHVNEGGIDIPFRPELLTPIPWQEGNLVVVKFSNGSLPRGRVLKAQTSNGSVRVQGHKGWICDFAAEMIELL
jgi:hypothetical protein